MSEKVLDTVKIMQMEIIYIHIFITAVESSAVFPLPASTRAMTPLHSYASMQASFLHTQVP
jgi:hypothetical protein